MATKRHKKHDRPVAEPTAPVGARDIHAAGATLLVFFVANPSDRF